MSSPPSYSAACRVAQTPDAWACEGCGSTATLWICLHDGSVHCEDNEHVAAYAQKHANAALWVEIQPPNRLFNWRSHREPRVTDAATLAVVVLIRNRLRDLHSMGGPKLAAARGWAKIRAAIRLFGHHSLSRPAQVERRKRDARETALRHWLHLEQWRAFRTWQRAAAGAPPSLPAAASAAAVAVPRKRTRGAERGNVTFEEVQAAPVTETAMDAPPRARWVVPLGIRAMHGMTGLRNLGNTCYMNSVLQALTHAPLFRALLFAVLPPSRRSIVDMLSSAVLGYDVTPTVVQHDAATGMPHLPPLMPRLARSNSALADVMEGASPTHMEVAVSPFIDPDVGSSSSAAAVPDSRRGSSRSGARVSNTKIAAPLHEVVSRIFGAGEQLAVYTPDAFLKAMWVRLPQFSGFNQQDAEEFLRALVNALHEEAAGGSASEGTLTRVSRSLGGTTVTSITCSACGHVSRRVETFLGPLGVEIPRDFRTTSRRGGGAAAAGECTLSMCFASTFRDEIMEGDNAYACEPCNKKVKAVLRVRLGELPPLLIVHIIRTDWMVQAKGGGSKIQTPVRVHVDDFDVSPWVEGATRPSVQPDAHKRRAGGTHQHDDSMGKDAATVLDATTYALQGVVEHMGSGLRQGHYVAYARDGDDFYNFNDAKVAAVQDAAVANVQCAYLMVFQRRDVKYA